MISFLAIETCLGSLRIFSASFLIGAGIVAENNNVCLSLGTNLKIFLISSRNPISNISSASSKITNFGDIWIWLFLSKSKSLPGVATTIEALCICLICLEYDVPP